MAKIPKRPSKPTSQTLRIEPSSRSGYSAKRLASLLVVQGAEIDLGRHVPCEEGPVVIGRDPDVGLPLSDGSISREHCRVEHDPRGGCYVLVDLGSTNGTSLNGVRVRDSVVLAQNDKIFLGASVIRFGYVDNVDLEYHARLEEMARTDPLTGLLTRRHYEAIFEVMRGEAIESEAALSVMIFDVDGLKLINDTHGHEMGAFTITETGRILRDELGARGVLARIGGDELIGCFPEMGKDEALTLASRARARVEAHAYRRDSVLARPTISIGVACFPDDAADPEELFELADRALYEAKRAGKNRVVAAVT